MKDDVMNIWKAYEIGDDTIEFTSPYLSKGDRVSALSISPKSFPKWKDILSGIETFPVKPIHDMVVGTTTIDKALPRPLYEIESSGKKWFVQGIRIKGITRMLAKHLSERRFRSRRFRTRHKRYCHNCLRVGIAVDKELKDFALGTTSFGDLAHEDSKNIVHHLHEMDITLVSSAVLVSNWNQTTSQESVSGTEIDLVGFDHENRRLVLIEIKITSSSFQDLYRQYKRCKKDKITGFMKCLLGRYIAQVVCTMKMYEKTYGSTGSHGLLVICEHRNNTPYSLELRSDDYDDNVFCGWMPGF